MLGTWTERNKKIMNGIALYDRSYCKPQRVLHIYFVRLCLFFIIRKYTVRGCASVLLYFDSQVLTSVDTFAELLQRLNQTGFCRNPPKRFTAYLYYSFEVCFDFNILKLSWSLNLNPIRDRLDFSGPIVEWITHPNSLGSQLKFVPKLFWKNKPNQSIVLGTKRFDCLKPCKSKKKNCI